MNLKTLSIFAISFLVFLILIFYNYFVAQKALKDTKASPLSIDLVSFPDSQTVGTRGTFIWRVIASPDLTASYTTIYWGSESSPSALTKSDSPQAVGYPNSVEEYRGRFALPLDFEQQILFTKPGTVYFRAYAKVGSDHLWTPEERLIIKKLSD